MADVGVVVDCGPAHVPCHLIFVEVSRHKQFLIEYESLFPYLDLRKGVEHSQLGRLSNGFN